jgi:protein-tyrosine phosphatase
VDRHIEFEGTFNFRDIGGYRTESGGSVRWRRVFRSGALDEMTARDQARARDEFGLSTVIDLRHPDEMEMYGPARTELAGTPVTNLNASIVPRSEAYRTYLDRVAERYGRLLSAERYGHLLTVGGEEIARAFELFADETAHAVVVHCTAGKDRTGTVIALLLEVLGVSREQIGSEYELSNLAIPRLIEYGDAKGQAPDLPMAERVARLETPAQRITDLMALVQREYGSARGFLTASGVSEQTLNRIVDLLVE